MESWKDKYDSVDWIVQEGRTWVMLNGKYGFVDEEGNEVIPLKYDLGLYFFKGRARVTLNGKYGVVDLQGNEVVPLKYDDIGYFSNDKASIRIGDCSGVVDMDGKEYFSPEDRAKLRKDKIQRILKSYKL
jgi:hypothetical protein